MVVLNDLENVTSPVKTLSSAQSIEIVTDAFIEAGQPSRLRTIRLEIHTAIRRCEELGPRIAAKFNFSEHDRTT
jgi:hypothetical protein